MRMPLSTKIVDNLFIEAYVHDLYNTSQPINVKFLRRSFNDHYLISFGDSKYILRVYLNNKITDMLFELDLLEYLAQNQLPVAYPIKSREFHYLHELVYQNEKRYLSLFSYAEGSPIEGILDKEQAMELGELIAQLHICSNDFKSPYSRVNMDIHYLLIEPIEEIERLAKELIISHRSLFTKYMKELIAYFIHFPKDNGVFGIVHGDLNPSNIHYSNSQRFTFFDFDHSGYGWRIHDLAVIKLCYSSDFIESVLDGYTSIRSLQSIETNSIGAYSDLLLIRKFKDILDMQPFHHNDDEKRKFIQNAVDTIHTLQ